MPPYLAEPVNPPGENRDYDGWSGTDPLIRNAEEGCTGIFDGLKTFFMPWTECTDGALVNRFDPENVWHGAVADTANTVGTFWIDTPPPPIVAANGTDPSEILGWLWNHTGWFVVIAFVVSMMLAFARIAMSRDARDAIALGGGMARFVLIMATLPAVVGTLLIVGDNYSKWIVDTALDGRQFGNAFFDMVFGSLSGAIGLVMTIVVVVMIVLLGITLVLLLVLRGAALVALCSMLPFVAATGLLRGGTRSLAQMCAWIAAFVAYKPVVATLLAAGFRLITAPPDDADVVGGLVNGMYGLALLVMTVFALPMLLRIVAPMMSPVAGSSGVGRTVGAGMAVLLPAGVGAAAGAAAARSTPPPPPPTQQGVTTP